MPPRRECYFIAANVCIFALGIAFFTFFFRQSSDIPRNFSQSTIAASPAQLPTNIQKTNAQNLDSPTPDPTSSSPSLLPSNAPSPYPTKAPSKPPIRFNLDDDIPLGFRNPLLDKYSSSIITTSKMNRCYQYPRCLLFDCCDADLRKHVLDYFLNQATSKQKEFSCMFEQDETMGCKYDVPFETRFSGHPFLGATLTHDILFDGLAQLPPTPPSAYNRLQARSHFKIVYMTQGQNRASLPEWYSHMSDLIFLSYKEQKGLDLYFPESNLCAGRLALYLAARIQELRQGWLYNYFIVLDDDAILAGGAKPSSLFLFELNLMQWQPAVGAPVYYPSYNFSEHVRAIIHIDYLMIAYHREALEILHPWILDHDNDCLWSSQVMQSFESAIVYRNHQLVFNVLQIDNQAHHEYKRNCWVKSGFPAVLETHKSSVPPKLTHCAVPPLIPFDVEEFIEYYAQGAVGGVPRPKLTKYHLITEMHHYPHTDQANCGGWHPKNPQCCTLDLSHNYDYSSLPSNGPLLAKYHGKIIYSSASRDGGVHFYVWQGERHALFGHETYTLMEISDEDFIEVDEDVLNDIPISLQYKYRHKYRGFPKGTIIKVQRENNVNNNTQVFSYFVMDDWHRFKHIDETTAFVKQPLSEHIEIDVGLLHHLSIENPHQSNQA